MGVAWDWAGCGLSSAATDNAELQELAALHALVGLKCLQA
jgi:hypothetical protein